MKTKRVSLFLISVIMTVTFSFGQTYILEDDIYYTPKAKNPVVEQKKKEKEKETYRENSRQETSYQYERDVDEYNRRSDVTVDDVVEAQKEQGESQKTSLKKSRTVGNDDYNYDDGEGYYLNGFNGSQSDYEYATRIRRFHNPRFTITIGDPGYNDIYFLNSSDWNVYIDGPYAWVTPTWSNPWYWNYTWAPASYGSWTWRMYPWGPYWGGGISWNWGYNWGWNSW